MSARNHEVTAKQQLLDANGNIAETVLDAFPMGKLQMPTNSSEGDIVYEKKNLRLKYVLEKNPENLSERSAVGKSIAGKEKTGRFYYNQKIKLYARGRFRRIWMFYVLRRRCTTGIKCKKYIDPYEKV